MSTNLRSPVDLVIEGPPAVRRALRGIQADLADLRPFWSRMRPIFGSWMREQFRSEGAWGGSRWRPLTDSYAAWKARRYPGRGILVATGGLRRASEGASMRATASHVAFTINHPVAPFHQFGTSRMTDRPIIPDRLPAQAQAEIKAALADYAADVLRRWT